MSPRWLQNHREGTRVTFAHFVSSNRVDWEGTEQMETAGFSRIFERIGANVLRYSLVFFLLFFGALKWTVEEARGVNPLIANSPFLSWADHLFGLQGASEFIGVIELAIALLIALRFWKPLLSAWGSMFAVGMFLITLSFLFTTPNVQQSVPFLLKDLSLLGASLWTAGEAFGAVARRGETA